MIRRRFTFLLEPFLKVEKVAIIDQNCKGLAFTFWPILVIFSTSLKRLKKA